VLVAGKVAAGLERPFVLDHQSLRIQTSIGIVTFPAHGEDRETLLRRADLAMYTAKREQRSHVVYHPAQEEHAPKHLMPTS
jgi:diguanylate cyclase (GGDEF)-like protein